MGMEKESVAYSVNAVEIKWRMHWQKRQMFYVEA